jgi:type I restriction enzyme S subunit
LEESARLLYKEWFVNLHFPGHEHTKVVDGVPEGWKRSTADRVMDVMSGGTPKTKVADFWDGKIPFFTPKDATDTVYVLTTEKLLTEDGLSSCNSKFYPKDTLFITARGTVGKLNLAQCDMAMNQSCYALKAKQQLSQHFLYCSLRAIIQQFQARATGAVFDAIVVDTFKRIPFLLPTPLLVADFTSNVLPIFRQIELLLQQNIKLTEARDLLLPRLMNGEIEV